MVTKKAGKVALIDMADYPKRSYSAYWDIWIDDDPADGFAWTVQLWSYRPLGWEYQGDVHMERPEAPYPVYPGDVQITQDVFETMSWARQQQVIASQDARRAQCAEIYEAHPKPVHFIGKFSGVASTKDEADTAAQKCAMEEMKKYRIQADKQAGYSMALGPGGMLLDALWELLRWLARPLLALAYSTTIRNEMLQRVQVNIDLGAGAGKWRIYDGTRPATGGSATTLLAELTFTDPAAPSASSGVLTFSAITADSSADATGTATWFRLVDSTATFCVDGNVGTSGSDLNLNSTSINVGVNVAISSAAITEGNP